MFQNVPYPIAAQNLLGALLSRPFSWTLGPGPLIFLLSGLLFAFLILLHRATLEAEGFWAGSITESLWPLLSMVLTGIAFSLWRFQRQKRHEQITLLSEQNKVLQENEKRLRHTITQMASQQEAHQKTRWLLSELKENNNINSTMQKAVEGIGQLLQVDRCLILRYCLKEDRFSLSSEALADDTIPSIQETGLLVERLPYLKDRVSKGRKMTLVDMMDLVPKPTSITTEPVIGDIMSMAMIPIIFQGELLGALAVHQTRDFRHWQTDEVNILMEVANHLALLIKQEINQKMLQEVNTLKSQFLITMSHELRTPLNAIIGFSDILLGKSSSCQTLSTHKHHHYLENISKSGDYLLNLINQILDLAKIEAGQMTLQCQLFEPHTSIHEIVGICEGMALPKKIQLAVSIASDVGHVYLDRERFHQILYNLLGNAIKFTPDGGQVNLNVLPSRHSSKILLIQVTDTGCGIASHDQALLFQDFQQIPSSTAKDFQGTGLGLALVKHLIEAHGGTIDFASQVDHGTTFTVKLPCHIQKISRQDFCVTQPKVMPTRKPSSWSSGLLPIRRSSHDSSGAASGRVRTKGALA